MIYNNAPEGASYCRDDCHDSYFWQGKWWQSDYHDEAGSYCKGCGTRLPPTGEAVERVDRSVALVALDCTSGVRCDECCADECPELSCVEARLAWAEKQAEQAKGD